MASDQTCQTDSLHSSLRKQSLLMSLVAECSLLPDGETPSTPSRSQLQGTFWRSLAGEILGWSSWALIFFHWSHHESSKRNLKKTTPCCRKTQIDGPNSLAERCKNEQNASLAILALTCFDKSRKPLLNHDKKQHTSPTQSKMHTSPTQSSMLQNLYGTTQHVAYNKCPTGNQAATGWPWSRNWNAMIYYGKWPFCCILLWKITFL